MEWVRSTERNPIVRGDYELDWRPRNWASAFPVHGSWTGYEWVNRSPESDMFWLDSETGEPAGPIGTLSHDIQPDELPEYHLAARLVRYKQTKAQNALDTSN